MYGKVTLEPQFIVDGRHAEYRLVLIYDGNRMMATYLKH